MTSRNATIPVHEAFLATVDGKPTFHRTFELAVRRLIRDNCKICAEPWGGNLSGNVYERNNFAIEKAKYVVGAEDKVVVDKHLLLHFAKDWEDGTEVLGDENAFGPRSSPELLKRIDRGFHRRWKHGWELVERHKARLTGISRPAPEITCAAKNNRKGTPMKIAKNAKGQQTLKITRQEWERLGQTKGWIQWPVKLAAKDGRPGSMTLPKKLTDQLADMPESGMGYQMVDLTFDDGSTLKDCAVTNCSEVNLPEEHRLKAIKSVKMASAASLRTWASIRAEWAPDGKQHNLTLHCPCGNGFTCRCMKPKRTFIGLCDRCRRQKGLTRPKATKARGGREITARPLAIPGGRSYTEVGPQNSNDAGNGDVAMFLSSGKSPLMDLRRFAKINAGTQKSEWDFPDPGPDPVDYPRPDDPPEPRPAPRPKPAPEPTGMDPGLAAAILLPLLPLVLLGLAAYGIAELVKKADEE